MSGSRTKALKAAWIFARNSGAIPNVWTKAAWRRWKRANRKQS